MAYWPVVCALFHLYMRRPAGVGGGGGGLRDRTFDCQMEMVRAIAFAPFSAFASLFRFFPFSIIATRTSGIGKFIVQSAIDAPYAGEKKNK